MNNNEVLLKIGLKSSGLYLATLLPCATLGFISIFVLAAVSTNVTTIYFIMAIIGLVASSIVTYKFLQKNMIRNALLISILAILSGVAAPIIGAVVMFPLLTVLLGKGQ